MSSKSKLLAKLLNASSDMNWTAEEAELILVQHGFKKHKSGGSSHRVFSHPKLAQNMCLAVHGKSIKSGYIRAIRQAIQAIPKEPQP